MSGFCACDYDDGDYPALSRTRTVAAARKPRTCNECGGSIDVGDRYQRWDVLYPEAGGWIVFAHCAPCLDGPIAFCLKNCGCAPYGEVLGHLTEVFREYPFERPGVKFRLGRMLVEMRRRGHIQARAA